MPSVTFEGGLDVDRVCGAAMSAAHLSASAWVFPALAEAARREFECAARVTFPNAGPGVGCVS